MALPQFTYGPFLQGLYIALIAVFPIIFVHWNEYAWPWVGFLLFLGFGLRPLLEKLGLVEMLESLGENFVQRVTKRSHEKHCRMIERKVRDKKYKGMHYKDERLPPNW